jgi:hypothetical protein
MNPILPPCCRRDFLRTAACGFGSLALAELIGEHTAAAPADPLAPRSPHFRPRAWRVLFLFMQAGPSQVDLFAHKPRLVQEHGLPIPFQRPKDEAEDGIERSKLLKPIAKLNRRGQAGLWWSDLLPHLSSQVDRLCVLNGVVADNPAHPSAVMQIQTGYTAGSHPAMGCVWPGGAGDPRIGRR